MNIVKVGNIELFEKDAETIYKSGKYIVSYKSVYSIHYSSNGGYYSSRVYNVPYKDDLPLTRRGRFITADAAQVNQLIGFRLLNE